jgi:predicted TIM-barrel fold metal-dependent hydrolase
MKKIIRRSLRVIISLIVLLVAFYFFAIYEKPINQEALNAFLIGQPIIDAHLHISRGNPESTLYNQYDNDIDLAKLKFTQEEFDKHNIVLALSGGPIPYAEMWAEADDRIWGGPILPCNPQSKFQQPCDDPFPDPEALRELYQRGTFKSMGELFSVFLGIPLDDPRYEPYWKLASEFDIPIGIHASTLPPPRPFSTERDNAPNFDGDAANPKLLMPILKRYPNLRIYLMHFGFDFYDESLALMEEYPNVYCDITGNSLMMPKIFWESNVKRLYEKGFEDRVMFGSDYTGTIRANIEVIYSMDWLSEGQKRDILYNNAAKFLKLSDEEIYRHHEAVKR